MGNVGDSLCETVNQSTSHLFSTNDHIMQCTERLAYPAVEQGSQELSAQQKMARHSCAGVQPGRATCDARLDSYAQFAAPSSDEALYCVLGAVVQFNFNKPVVTYTHLLTAQAVGGGRNY